MQQLSDGILPGSCIYFQNAGPDTKNTFFYPLCIGNFHCSPAYRVERSSYDSFLLLYVTKGEGVLLLDGNELPVSCGQVALIDCYKTHSYYTKTGWNILWMHVDGPCCRLYYEKIVQNTGNIRTLNDSHTLEHFHSIFTHLLHSYRNQAPYSDAIISKYITDMLTLLFTPSDAHYENSELPSSLDSVLSFIQNHFTEPITIDELAAQVSLSSYHFIRMFKKETGMTPHQYLIQMRIGSAKFYLRSTTSSIKEIAYTCGFQSENNFCICFKKLLGMTPGEYRKQ